MGLITVQGKQPLFSFGVISDVQFADIPDGRSFLGVPRYYRHSILVLQRAVQKWNDFKHLSFAVNFGDIVDGFCPKDQSLCSVKKIASEFEEFNGPVYHMIGNHCLYNVSREELLPLLKIPSRNGSAYYDFSPIPGFRLVVLDGYDISAIGWPQDHPKSMEAVRFLKEKNPNSDKNSPVGLDGLERRFVMFNGAIGRVQLDWLDLVLQNATDLKQKVIICCHLPLDPGATSPEALLWNYDEVMDIIHKYTCVKACLGGHEHKGGYSIDSWNSHHIVFLVDNIPVREVQNTPAMSSNYPSKPMAVYATIWDASPWATHGGKYPVNYKYAPFTASLGQMEMAGCVYDRKDISGKSCSKSSSPSSLDPVDGQDFIKLSNQQIQGLQWVKTKQMIYSYCKDKRRYNVLPPECHTK